MREVDKYQVPTADSIAEADRQQKAGNKPGKGDKAPAKKAVETKKHDALDKPEGITGNTSLKEDLTSGG